MQKPIFFTILAVSLVITAVSLGFAASRYLSILYYAPPDAPASADPRVTGENRTAVSPDQWTNIFAPSAGMGIPSRYKADAGIAVPESGTQYMLLGTISSEMRTLRRAILWAEGMSDPLITREQEEIEPGVRVASVERSHVMLSRGGREEKLELLPVGSRTRGSAVSVPSPVASRSREARPAPGPAAGGIQVNRLGENAFSMDEATVGELTGNINQFMTQARIIPYFEGNKSAGYRLAALRPGSAFEQLGFKAGDIIQRVNAVELNSPEKMYTIFQNLKDEKRVTVDVLRQGQKSTLTYEIR